MDGVWQWNFRFADKWVCFTLNTSLITLIRCMVERSTRFMQFGMICRLPINPGKQSQVYWNGLVQIWTARIHHDRNAIVHSPDLRHPPKGLGYELVH